MRNIVPELERIIRDRLIGWPPDWEGYHWPGYTYEHTLRVRDLALTLAERERADPDVVLLAALLHDIRKDSGRDHAEVGANEAGRILKDLGVSDRISARVCERYHFIPAPTRRTVPSRACVSGMRTSSTGTSESSRSGVS